MTITVTEAQMPLSGMRTVLKRSVDAAADHEYAVKGVIALLNRIRPCVPTKAAIGPDELDVAACDLLAEIGRADLPDEARAWLGWGVNLFYRRLREAAEINLSLGEIPA